MNKTIRLIAVLAAVHAVPAIAEPPAVSLADYAFDFPTYGYEITVSGTTRNMMDKLTADDHIFISDSDYTLKTLIDRMGRSDRREFMQFFNEHCIGFDPAVACPINAAGDIELDDKMRMVFRPTVVTISKDGNEWTNSQ